MHLVFATRGIKHARDMFVTQIQSQFFPWKRKDLKTGVDEHVRVQGALRPIELWEYVFPEEHYEEVCTMLGFDPNGKVHPFSAKLNQKALRMALGLKPIKKFTPKVTDKFVFSEGVAKYPIGIKYDKHQKNKEWGYEQEML